MMGTVLALALCAALVACDSDGGIDPGACDIEPTLSSIHAKAFAPGCVFDSGCHNQQDMEGDLDLETVAGLHGRLVGALAADENARGRGKVLVVAGDPENSFLLQKLEGRHASDEGELMPDGTDEPVDVECRIAQIRAWIAAGAAND